MTTFDSVIVLVPLALVLVITIKVLIIRNVRLNFYTPTALFFIFASLHITLPTILFLAGVWELKFPINTSVVYQAISYSLICIIAYFIGSQFALSQVPSDRVFSEDKVGMAHKATPILFVLLVLGIFAKLIIIQSGAYFQFARTGGGTLSVGLLSTVFQLERFGMFAVQLLIASYALRRRGVRHVPRFIKALFLFEVLYWLGTGRKEAIFTLFINYFMLRTIVDGDRLPIKAGLVGVVAMILLFPLMWIYRFLLSTQSSSDAIGAGSVFEKVAGVSFNIFDVIIERLAFLDTISAAIRIHSVGSDAFSLSNIYLNGILGVIPRMLWPEKPSLALGERFAWEGGFISKFDYFTSVNPTYFGESFLALGYSGCLVFLLFGFAINVAFEFARGRFDRMSFLIFYLPMTPTLFYLGGTFALYFSGAIKEILISTLIIFVSTLIPTKRCG